MIISKDKIDKIAKLAKLNLPDTTLKFMQSKFNDIVMFMSKLNELDTSETEPLSHPVDVMNVTRAEEKKRSLSAEEAMSGAPEKSGSFFKVPKVIVR